MTLINYNELLEEQEKKRLAEIKEDLYQWGIWSRKDGTGKLRDTSGAMYKNMPRAANEEFPLVITDEYAEQIDEIMLEINLNDKALYEIAELTFIKNISTRGIERISKHRASFSEKKPLTRSTIHRKVNDIVNYVEQKLNQMLK